MLLECTGTTLTLAHDFSVYYILHGTSGLHEIWLPFASRLKLWQVWFYGIAVQDVRLPAIGHVPWVYQPGLLHCNLLSASIQNLQSLISYTLVITFFRTSSVAVSWNRKGTPALLSRLGNNPWGGTTPHPRHLIAHPANISHKPTHRPTRAQDGTISPYSSTDTHYVCTYHFIHWWLRDKCVAFYEEYKITFWVSFLCVSYEKVLKISANYLWPKSVRITFEHPSMKEGLTV